jgi:hypothetical protein
MFIDILIALLGLLLIAAFPAWRHARAWGYLPSAGIAIILFVVVILRMLRVV